MIRLALLVVVVLHALALQVSAQLTLSWTNNLMTVRGDHLPGGTMDVWYLEAFCRKGSTKREWGKTTLPHKTQLISATSNALSFRTTVQPNIEVLHEVRAGVDEISITFDLHNKGDEAVDVEWFQPACIRVERFTECVQSNYTGKSFIFTERGLTTLAATRRTEEALYRGGQVYVPAGINLNDVNPRPICLDKPVNGLIGCFSADGKYLLATASSATHEVFEGVYVCLHSDPHIGGLRAGEKKQIRSKIYLIKNDVEELLRRYKRDFREFQ